MLTKKQKEKVVDKYKTSKLDTGSADVQIALLSDEIKGLLKHLKSHPKDNHSRRGLLKMVIKRKRLLSYLEQTNKRRYTAIITKIGLKEKSK